MFEFGVRREGHLRISAVLKSRLLPLRETLLSSYAFEKRASEFLCFGVSKLKHTAARSEPVSDLSRAKRGDTSFYPAFSHGSWAGLWCQCPPAGAFAFLHCMLVTDDVGWCRDRDERGATRVVHFGALLHSPLSLFTFYLAYCACQSKSRVSS